MKLVELAAVAKTKTVESSLIPGMWLSRSAVSLQMKSGCRCPVFGFASDFDSELSQRKATFELIEHLAFHPEKPLLSSSDVTLRQRSNGRWQNADGISLDSLLLGATNFGEILHGNGCAVHRNLREAVKHAENEALERHYCCEMWYNRNIRPRPLIFDMPINHDFGACIKVYELETPAADHLVISIIDADFLDFFCMGASFKPTKQAAIRHSLGEAATFFEDALRNRMGRASTAYATAKILSLRQRELSQRRKRYFSSLLALGRCRVEPSHPPTVYAFPVLDGLIATRASTAGLLTPRRYHDKVTSAPTMPLF